jgi:hypothetical protein
MYITEQAQNIVFGDREQTYGDPNQNFKRIADYWNVYLGERLLPDQVIDMKDVAMMMALLKVAREMNKSTWDGPLDIIGYMACLSRMPEYAGLNPTAGATAPNPNPITNQKVDTTKAPGSLRAVAEGCTCDPAENFGGRGEPMNRGMVKWHIAPGCPVHTDEVPA